MEEILDLFERSGATSSFRNQIVELDNPEHVLLEMKSLSGMRLLHFAAQFNASNAVSIKI
jgi:hypothetical protein